MCSRYVNDCSLHRWKATKGILANTALCHIQILTNDSRFLLWLSCNRYWRSGDRVAWAHQMRMSHPLEKSHDASASPRKMPFGKYHTLKISNTPIHTASNKIFDVFSQRILNRRQKDRLVRLVWGINRKSQQRSAHITNNAVDNDVYHSEWYILDGSLDECGQSAAENVVDIANIW